MLTKVEWGQGGRGHPRQKETHLQRPRGKPDTLEDGKGGRCGQGSREGGRRGEGDGWTALSLPGVADGPLTSSEAQARPNRTDTSHRLEPGPVPLLS